MLIVRCAGVLPSGAHPVKNCMPWGHKIEKKKRGRGGEERVENWADKKEYEWDVNLVTQPISNVCLSKGKNKGQKKD